MGDEEQQLISDAKVQRLRQHLIIRGAKQHKGGDQVTPCVQQQQAELPGKHQQTENTLAGLENVLLKNIRNTRHISILEKKPAPSICTVCQLAVRREGGFPAASIHRTCPVSALSSQIRQETLQKKTK